VIVLCPTETGPDGGCIRVPRLDGGPDLVLESASAIAERVFAAGPVRKFDDRAGRPPTDRFEEADVRLLVSPMAVLGAAARYRDGACPPCVCVCGGHTLLGPSREEPAAGCLAPGRSIRKDHGGETDESATALWLVTTLVVPALVDGAAPPVVPLPPSHIVLPQRSEADLQAAITLELHGDCICQHVCLQPEDGGTES
jgi:hypothetical protein